jgi:hypothetical protein
VRAVLGVGWTAYSPSGTPPDSPYRTPDLNQPTTSYAYDALGRTLLITNTDGSSVENQYDYPTDYGWRTRTWDENEVRHEVAG